MKNAKLLLCLSALILASCGGYDSSSSPSRSSSSSSSQPESSQSSASSSAQSETSSEAEPSSATSEETSGEESSAEPSSVTSEETSGEESSAEPSSEEFPEESSSEESSSIEKQHFEVDFTAPISKLNDKSDGVIEAPIHYDSDYFEADNLVINYDMILFAFAMANSAKVTEEDNRAETVFSAAGFDEHYDDSSLKEAIGFDTVGYAIGSRKVSGVDQIVVAVRGEEYKLEWDSNFTGIPSEEDSRDNGDHFGFRISAMEVVDALKSFISEYSITKAKILFTGYSRGGTVAGIAASMFLDDPVACEASDIYGYTFATPAGILNEHAKEADNCIFNFINENDFITHIMPAEYGFRRPGVDVSISNGIVQYAPIFKEYEMYEAEVDESADFAAFKLVDEEGKPKNSGKDAADFIVKILTRELSENDIAHGVVSYHTKDEFFGNLQEAFHTLIRNFFTLNIKFNTDSMMSVLSEALALIVGLSYDDGFEAEGEESQPYNPDALYNLLEAILKLSNVYPEGEDPEEIPEDTTITHYNKEEIKGACAKAQELLRNLQLGMTEYGVSQGLDVSEARVELATFLLAVVMNNGVALRHSFDTNYALVRHFVDANKAE